MSSLDEPVIRKRLSPDRALISKDSIVLNDYWKSFVASGHVVVVTITIPRPARVLARGQKLSF